MSSSFIGKGGYRFVYSVLAPHPGPLLLPLLLFVGVEVLVSFLMATKTMGSDKYFTSFFSVTLSVLDFSILTDTRAEGSTPSFCFCTSISNGVEGEISVPITGRTVIAVEVVTGREEGITKGMAGETGVCSDSVSAMLPSHRLLAPSRDSFLASKDSLSCPSRASRQTNRQSPAT